VRGRPLSDAWLASLADGFVFGWSLVGFLSIPTAAGEVRNKYVAPQTEGPGLKPVCKLNFFAGLKPCANPKQQDDDFFPGAARSRVGFLRLR
jgi:hypothetical protein